MAVDPPHRIPGATDTTTYTLDPAPLQGRDELVEEVAESLRRVNHSPPWGVSIWTAFARAALAVAARRQGGEYERGRADERAAVVARLRASTAEDRLGPVYARLIEMGDHLAAPHGEEGKR